MRHCDDIVHTMNIIEQQLL